MELCKAILNGNVRQLAQLCKEGRNVSKRTGRLGVMPLHVACAVGNVDAVRVLLGNPTVLPTAVDQAHNRTPLHWALANGHFECASLLVQRGVADEALDKEQRSAYDLFRQRLHDAGLLAAAAVVSELWTWGNGASHQLGHGTTEQVRLPKKVKGLPPSSPVAAAAISSFTGFAATEGGTVWSWGSQRARLGQTEGEDVQPRPCPVRALRGKRVVHLAASAQHALAVTDAGHVYSWGLGKDGKLGHDSEESVATPRRVTGGGLERAFCVSAAASDVHSCVLTSQGDLYTFGFGGDGQLGHSSYLSALKPKLVTSIGQVVCVAASRTHTAVVVSSRKEVYIFGCHFATPVKRHIPKEEVVHCAAVARGTLFATRSGNIYQADATEIAVPVQINGIPRRIRQISGCDETFAAVDHNGIIYVWSYARVTTGTAKVKADVYTDLRGRMPHVVAAKNSYAAIVHTPQIAPAAAAAPAQLAEHLSALLPPALLRELGLAPPAPAATPGDVRLAFCHDGAPAAAPVLALAAHKFLLHARCPALRPALHADALAVPVPPDVPRAALAALVYYVYTGRAAPLAHAAPPPDALRVLARRLGLRHLDADLAAERAASPAPLADEDDEGELPAPRAQQPPPRATLAADFAAALEPEGFPHADMAVHLQGAAVRVNRALLDARSDYFRTLMHVGMAEARSGDIHLGSEDLTLPSLRTLIHYFYTDELRVEDTADDVTALMEVIVAANEMLADGLKQRAESALMCHLTLSNVAQFTLFAEHYEATNLLECCTTYLARHVYLVPSVLASFPPSVLRRMQQSLAGSLPPEALLAQLRESAGADATSPKKRSSLEAKEEGAEAEAEAVDATETAGAAEAEAEAEVEAEAEAGTAEEEALSEASGAAAEAVVRADGDGGRELAAPAPASPWKAQAAAQPSLAAIQRQEQMESAARRKPAAAGPAKAPGEAEAAAEREEGRAPALSAKKKRMPLAAFLKPEAAPRPSLHAPAPWAAAAKPAAAAVSLVEVQQREAAANERRAASEKAALRSSAPSAQEHAGAKLSQSGGRADFPPLRNSTPAMAVASAPRAEAEAEAASPARRTLVEIQEEERRRASEVARMKAPPRVDLKAVQEEERRQKKEQDDMRTLRALGFTEEEARNGLEMFLGDVQQVVANLLYVVDERNAAATAAALATSPPKGGGVPRGRRGGGGGRGRRGQHAP